ncbi:MAG: sulfite exporter TauE/SafE family protein [Myxococcota bacterium]|nr:sulfite exporter TauE/SafE family protein [Myxococcota bacterium]
MYEHGHQHGVGHPSVHDHGHGQDEAVRQAGAVDPEHAPASWKSLTPWLLFLVFVLGPCEPLIPLFFASALAGSWHEVVLVVLGYGLATLFAMHVLVALFWFGLRQVHLGPLERWMHAIAGGVILLAGIGMVFLGL